MYAHHSFIRSPTDGPLGCFLTLAVVNNAAVTTGYRRLSELVLSRSSDKYPEVELLGHMTVLSVTV